MDWARTSCWMRSAGGLTSRDEYSMAGSVPLEDVSVREALFVAGNWVRSMDGGGVRRACAYVQPCLLTASIHHPFSSSWSTIRDF